MKYPRYWLPIFGLYSLVTIGLSSAQEAAAPKVSLTDKKVLWLGDSITQAGDYVTFVQYYLDKHFPDKKVDIISIGLASETTSGLSEKAHPFPRPCVLERLPRALDMVKPAVVVACYGMNDGIYYPAGDDRMQAFQKGIHALISQSKAAGAQVVLLSPPPFDKMPVKSLRPLDAPDFSFMTPYEDYDSVLGDFAKWEQTLSSGDALPIDLHTPIDDYLALRRRTNPKFGFTRDGIHPNPLGHLLMAETILENLGYSIPFDADLEKEWAAVKADPLYALVKRQREGCSSGWLAYVGYTRQKQVKANSVDQAGQAGANLQIQIDKLRKGQ